jgi:hypothetical protein
MPKQSGALSVLGSGLMALLIWAQHSLVWAQAPAPLTPALGQLSQTNPFDTERKLWPDRTPPPPPPPVSAPVTDADLEVYGVVMAGGAQKALLKLGKRFEGVPVGPNGIAVVPVGGQLGEFVLSQLTPDQILLKAPGGQQWIRFSAKKDRSSGGQVANQTAAPLQPQGQLPVFGATSVGSAPSGVPAGGSGGVPLIGGGSPQGMGSAAAGVPIGSAGGGAPSGQPEAPPAPPPGSLAAAIFAAQAAQKAGADGAAPAGSAPGTNPFEALFQQQKK